MESIAERTNQKLEEVLSKQIGMRQSPSSMNDFLLISFYFMISLKRVFDHDSLKNACGSYTFRNGNHYEGDWLNNQRHGYGRMLYYSNTNPLDNFIEVFEGEWKKGKKNGYGR